MSLEYELERFFDKIENMVSILKNAFRELILKPKGVFVRDMDISDYAWVFDTMCLVHTNYKCDKCGGMLGRSRKYYDDIIIFKCSDCGKVHKAYKNNLLGRFEMF